MISLEFVHHPGLFLPPGPAVPLPPGSRPEDDYVVTWTQDGAVASLYGDSSWNVEAYSGTARIKNLYFLPWAPESMTVARWELVAEIKWIVFLLTFVGDEIPAVATISTKLKLLRELAKFADSTGKSVAEVVAQASSIIEFVNQSGIKCAVRLHAILKFLDHLGLRKTGLITACRDVAATLLAMHAETSDTNRQHAPMPTRVYSHFLASLKVEIAQAEEVCDRLIEVLKYCSSSRLAGRTASNQRRNRRQLGLQTPERYDDFPTILSKYELRDYFLARGYSAKVQGLTRALSNVFMLVQLQVQAYTGMRAGEVAVLPYDCLIEETRSGVSHHLVGGITTKMSKGRIKRTRWVTNRAGRDAILLAQRLSRALYHCAGLEPQGNDKGRSEYKLFVKPTTGVEKLQPTRPSNPELSGFREMFDRLLPRTEAVDLQELNDIDPHRGWDLEPEYQIGRVWPFKRHQLRRSLALYAQRSGLVSLPSLKRQLQHITHEMSLYYARGSNFAKDFIGEDRSHFGREWQDTQPLSQYLSYAAHVLFTDEKPEGGHGNWVNVRLRQADGTVLADREVTLRRFEKGELAFKETPLGGCTNPGVCSSPALDVLDIDCLSTGCRNMVLSPRKLDRVIIAQTKSVDALRNLAPESIEYRTEARELSVLLAAREKLKSTSSSTGGAA